MSSVFELVRHSPFGGPVAHAKCEGLKVNDERTVAALATGSGSGTDALNISSTCIHLKEGILSTITDLSCSRSNQLVMGWKVLPKTRLVPIWTGCIKSLQFSQKKKD